MMFIIIIVVIIIAIILYENKNRINPVNHQNAETKYYSPIENQNPINNTVEIKKPSSHLLEGIIKDFDKKAHVGTVSSNGKEYRIIFHGNQKYNNFPNFEPRVGNKVVFCPQTVDGGLYATDIEYISSDESGTINENTGNIKNVYNMETIDSIEDIEVSKNIKNTDNKENTKWTEEKLKVVRKDMECMDANNYKVKNVNSDIENVEWSKKTLEIRYSNAEEMDASTLYDFLLFESGESQSTVPYMSRYNLRYTYGNIYSSSYVCPTCTLPLYKTIFPVGKEYPIMVRGNIVRNSAYVHKMKRVFTCIYCKSYYTSVGSRLSEGSVFQLYPKDKNQYFQLFSQFNEKGTTEGRAD